MSTPAKSRKPRPSRRPKHPFTPIPIEHCLVINDNGDAYVIRADEIAVYCHWESARAGQHSFPRDFKPFKVRDLEKLRFTGWREEGAQ